MVETVVGGNSVMISRREEAVNYGILQGLGFEVSPNLVKRVIRVVIMVSILVETIPIRHLTSCTYSSVAAVRSDDLGIPAIIPLRFRMQSFCPLGFCIGIEVAQ